MDKESVDYRVDHRRKGQIITLLIHALVLLFCLWPTFGYKIDRQPLAGILVQFGQVESNDDSDDASELEELFPDPGEDDIQQDEEKIESVKEEVLQEDTEEEEIKRREEKKEEDDGHEQKEQEEKRQRYEEQKSKFSDLFKKGADNSEKEGDPTGAPDASKVEGISTGKGTVGAGLSDRGIVSAPDISDDSQRRGKVVVVICVDDTGTVISAEYTQRGSTTTDPYLIEIAEESAKLWKFSAGEMEKQCGTISIDFKVE